MDRAISLQSRRIDLPIELPFELGGARVNPLAHEITIGGKSARMQPQILKVLIALNDRIGDVVTRDELVDRCWDGRVVGEDVINRCISLLRRFEAEAGGFRIETVPRAGYRLVKTPRARTGVMRSWAALIVAAVLATVAVGWYIADQSSDRKDAGPAAAIPSRELEVRLAGFTALSPDISPEFLQSLRDETLAAFADDGAIGISTAIKPNAPSADRYQISGAIRRQGSRYEVISRIDDAKTGASLWSHSFDYASADRHRLARHVALDLAKIMRCGFGRAITYLETLPDGTLRLLFASCENDGTVDTELDRALDYSRRVTLASPDFSFGWSSLAGTAVVLGPQKPPAEAAAIASEASHAIDTALRLDPRNSEAWALKAYLLPANKFAEREALLKRAIAARPLDCGCEHHAYGVFLREVGRLKQAEVEFRRAIDIMHINEDFYGDLALTQFADGNTAEAIRTAAAGNAVSSHLEEYDQLFVRAVAWTGDYAMARKVLNYPSFRDNAKMRLLIQPVEALESRDPAAIAQARRTLLPLALDPANHRPVLISLLAALGDTDDALAAVQRLALTDGAAAHQVLFEPELANARGTAAFWDTATKLGLVDYWRKSHQRPDFCRSKPEPVCANIVRRTG